MHYLLDALKDEATSAAFQDEIGMEKKGWEVFGCLHLSKNEGGRKMILSQWKL